MRTILSTLIFTLIGLSAISQPPAGAMRGGGQQLTGRLYGKIVDSKSGKAVEYASVQLLQNRLDTVTKQRKETVIGGMLTKSNGEFSIENVPVFGPLTLKITAIGFKEFTQPVSFNFKPGGGGDPAAMLGALDKDLGNIKIEIEEKVLDNVTVTSSRPGLQLGIDRKVFNVDKNIVSSGGTAVDIMRNIPSLNVDIDGNVTMRNNTPQLFVDGRPTTLTLEQIPSDAIQSVEMITNPSAKFDASGGTAGILNVVLKKEKKVGYNGSLRANIDSRAKVGLGGDINLRQQKVNLFASGMFNQRKSISTGHTERSNFFTTPQVNQTQVDRSEMEGGFGFGRVGVDYFINNRNTLSLSGNFARGKFEPESESNITYDSLYNPVRSAYEQRLTNSSGNFRNIGSTLSFKHNFPKAGMEWTADVTYNRGRSNNNNYITSNLYDQPQGSLTRGYKQQQQIASDNENLIMQTDYVNPINEKTKLEMGLRAQLRNNNSANAFYFADADDKWVLQPTSQIDYKSNDQVYAAYVSVSSQVKNFGYQLGLRAENSRYEGELLKTGELFNIKFPVSLFPSVFLNQKLSDDQTLQLNYTRRINRPNYWQLTPFTDSSDRLNPSQGNPNLRPEFTNSFELSYEKSFRSKGNFLASLYFKHTDDLITRFQETAEASPGDTIFINKFINANSSYVTGLELTTRLNIYKWWEFTPNFNLYMSDIKIDMPGEPDQEALTSYFVKVNNTFKLPKNISIQLSGDYQSKTILPPGGSGGGGRGGGGMMHGGSMSASQGYIRPNYGIDIGIRYEFLKNRTASLSLNVNDILRTRRMDVYSQSSLMEQNSFRRRDPQVARLNFSWRFGKMDPNLFKRKNMKGERESQNIDMGGMGQ